MSVAAWVNNLPVLLQNLIGGSKQLGDIEGLAAGLRDMKHASTSDAVTASTTQTQAGGTVLLAAITRVTVANSGDAVTLGFGATAGRSFEIINDSGQPIALFPQGGDKINDASASASVSIADNTFSRYSCPVGGKWFGGPVTLET